MIVWPGLFWHRTRNHRALAFETIFFAESRIAAISARVAVAMVVADGSWRRAVPHHVILCGFGAGVAKGDSGLIHRSLENGGFHDPCFATPRDVKAHIAWCGLLLYHTMRFWGVFRLVWHTGWERISRTDE